jgi:hypothetical protein
MAGHLAVAAALDGYPGTVTDWISQRGQGDGARAT